MNMTDALEIVLDLAFSNVLDRREAEENELVDERNNQLKACSKVTKLFKLIKD